MTVAVLELAEIVARLAGAGIYRTVGGAAELARIAERGLAGSPHGFVLPGSESVTRQGFAGGQAQRSVTARVFVITVAEDLRADEGARALSRLETARAGLIGALAGWRPDFAAAPLEHVRGQLVTGAMPGGLLGWQDEFEVVFRRTITLN